MLASLKVYAHKKVTINEGLFRKCTWHRCRNQDLNLHWIELLCNTELENVVENFQKNLPTGSNPYAIDSINKHAKEMILDRNWLRSGQKHSVCSLQLTQWICKCEKNQLIIFNWFYLILMVDGLLFSSSTFNAICSLIMYFFLVHSIFSLILQNCWNWIVKKWRSKSI